MVMLTFLWYHVEPDRVNRCACGLSRLLMTGDAPQMKQLHDRATRGHTLTADEQAQLDAWYAAQDAAEAATLGVATLPDDLRDLQAGVEQAIARILSTSRQIQELTAQNTRLRSEIADLQQRLRHLPSTHAA